MALPKAIRRLAPDRLRDDVRLRSVFVGAGLIPPRTMHSDDDAAVLRATATGRRRVVELGVYEGSSAVVLCEVLDAGAELHLVDTFGHQAGHCRRGGGRPKARAAGSSPAPRAATRPARDLARRLQQRASPGAGRVPSTSSSSTATTARRACAPTGRTGTPSSSPAGRCCSTTRVCRRRAARASRPDGGGRLRLPRAGSGPGWSVLREADRRSPSSATLAALRGRDRAHRGGGASACFLARAARRKASIELLSLRRGPESNVGLPTGHGRTDVASRGAGAYFFPR